MNVKTSRDGVFFDNDASYRYYLHGPLARVEIGDERVQGIDYIYTLQGWIKGVNSNSLIVSTDPGKDGNTFGINKNFARDAFGYSLNYFGGDYQAIDPNKSLSANNFIASTEDFTNLAVDAPSLYNGNISSMVTTITDPAENNVLPQFTMYKYDQLNRLKNMKAFADFDFDNNIWNDNVYAGLYQNDYSYDANGNLLTLQRNNQDGRMFDDFTYNYYKVDDKTYSNRLYHVNDSEDASLMNDDIDDQGTFSEAFETINSWNNYGYDEIGNLQRDSIEGIKHIEWTAYGKIKSITRVDGYYKVINGVDIFPSNLEFLYDATGNRIAKIEKPRDENGEKSAAHYKTTYYIRDAQGNPMATYSQSSQSEEASYKLIERPIYGSSRLGIDNYEIEFIGYTPPTNQVTNHILGLKQYELSNHLGNVLTTISDKKFPIENNGLIDYYVADITSVSDYYPFGSPMDGRTFKSEKYRYGFNTQEKLDEVYGKGNLSTALFWEYDTRLGRRWNLDPVVKHNLSNYSVLSDNPIIFVDPNGDDDYYNKAGKYIGTYGNGTAIRITNARTIEMLKNWVEDHGIEAVNELSPIVTVQNVVEEQIKAIYTNSVNDQVERKAFFILDTENATLSIFDQEIHPDDKIDQCVIEYDRSILLNTSHNFIHIKGQSTKVIVGQIHGHPSSSETGETDKSAAQEMIVPVHAVGENGNVNRVKPDGGRQNVNNQRVLIDSLEISGGKQ